MMITRRHFLAGTAGAVLTSRWSAAAPLVPVTRSSRALGAAVQITLFHDTADVAAKAAEAALTEIDRIDRLLSLYRPDSQISILNRDGKIDDAHADLLAILGKCQSLSEVTASAFDITVQPLWDLYAKAKKAGKLPSEDELAAARTKVDYRKLKIEGNRVRLEPDMAITLNAIAQGFAADAAAGILRRAGVRHAMIDTGEIATIGGKPDGEPWSIGIQHPREKDAYIAVAKLKDRCLSTSGDYATTFTDDRAYHHIFNPATGRSPDDFASVTIVAGSATEADSLSTACMVMGLDRSLKLIRALKQVEAMFVFKDGRSVATKGFPG